MTSPIQLVQIVDAALADSVRRSGAWLACRPGCSQCCHGVFAISALDAHRLREGLHELRRSDPARAAAVDTRALASRHPPRSHLPRRPRLRRPRLYRRSSRDLRNLRRRRALPCPRSRYPDLRSLRRPSHPLPHLRPTAPHPGRRPRRLRALLRRRLARRNRSLPARPHHPSPPSKKPKPSSPYTPLPPPATTSPSAPSSSSPSPRRVLR